MPQLHDLDRVRSDFLPFLAQWVGWDLDYSLPVFSQRNEVKAAPPFYRTVGSVPNLRSLVTRYTGWYTQVAEFAQRIVRSNAPAQFNLFAIQQSGTTW
ncbi:MAG TPA: phage tail protein, partial [Cyanophyceae cyanobacterium]